MKAYLLNLNLFPPNNSSTEENEHEHRSNIISTRVYIVLLVSTLIGFTLGLSLLLQTSKFTLQYPTEAQVRGLPLDAKCPCSHISLSYGQFTSIKATFHQVCSSDFVSDRWINAIYYGSKSTKFDPADFRTSGSAQFQALASFCRLAKNNIYRSLASFNVTSFISPQLVPEMVLESQVNATIEQFQLTVPDDFVSQMTLVREMTLGNRLISALMTNVKYSYTYDNKTNLYNAISSIRAYWPHYEKGHCFSTSFNYTKPLGIYNESKDVSSLQMEIPGLMASCLPVNSLLQSTLECFYNQTCLNKLLSFLSTNESFVPIPVLKNSRFDLDSTILSILDLLMVEQWVTNISYTNYFVQCAPTSCSFLKVERHNFIYVLSKVVGLLGGLILILRLVIPTTVRILRRWKNKESTPRIPLSIRFRQLQVSGKRFLIQLNLFKSHRHDDRNIRYQRIATRLYISILVILLAIFVIYLSLAENIHRRTVYNQTESQYTYLQKIYRDGLVCPCSLLSISRKSFISINPVRHEICFSTLVSNLWIRNLLWNDIVNSLTNDQINSSYKSQNTVAHFHLLKVFCEMTQQTIINARRVFLETPFVGSQVIKQNIFHSQINLLIEDWKLDTVKKFERTIQLIQAANQGNKLMNELSDGEIEIDQISGQTWPRTPKFSNSSCDLHGSCSTPLVVSRFYWREQFFVNEHTIPNFFIGCFLVEALLQSTLECFYNRTCMLVFNQGSMEKYPTNYSTLNESRKSPPNETIKSIVNRLMVDDWQSNVSFTSYYNACAPLSCTYEYTSRRNFLIFITIMIGIISGLSTGLGILFVICLRFIEKVVENVSHFAFKQFIKNIFTPRTEQQIATRLHIVLLVTILSTISLVTFLTPQSETDSTNKPSLFTFENIVTRFSKFPKCPCSQISIKYQSFLTIVPQFHQVCLSDFVADRWIKYVYDENNRFKRLSHTDFRSTAIGQFQLLASFCRLSQDTVNSALSQLRTSDHINAQLSTPNGLNEQIQRIIHEFQLTTSNSFRNIFDLIRETTRGNMLMSVLSTNWKFSDANVTSGKDGNLSTIPLDYQECNCGLSSKCIQTSRGMMAGCYPIEALHQTTLRCFYDQQCIDPNNNFKALNSSLSRASRFPTNATIEFILNQLMVENYTTNLTYKNYFTECAPLSCSYIHFARRSTMDIVTSLISIYGGLTVISEWIIVLILRLCQRRIRQIYPVNVG